MGLALCVFGGIYEVLSGALAVPWYRLMFDGLELWLELAPLTELAWRLQDFQGS